jgi:hypothetical protein
LKYLSWFRRLGIEKLTNILLAAFTFILMIVAIQQYRFGHVTERAYVVAKSLDNDVRDLQVGKTPWVQLAMDNEGHTPAYHVMGTQVLEVALSQFPKKATFKRNQTRENEATIFSGVPLGMVASEKHPLTQIELDGIKSGKYRACAWGDITYEDAFGVSHYTNFCLCYSSSPPAVYCPYHNDAE